MIRSHLEAWINGERFPAFPKITAGGLNELSEFNKRIVMVTVNGKDKVNYALHERFVIIMLYCICIDYIVIMTYQLLVMCINYRSNTRMLLLNFHYLKTSRCYNNLGLMQIIDFWDIF